MGLRMYEVYMGGYVLMTLKGYILLMQSSLLTDYLRVLNRGLSRDELVGLYTKTLPKLSFSYSINLDLEQNV